MANSNTVQKKVIINTEVVGLDKAKKDMEVLSKPAVLSLDDKENKKLLKEREAIMKEIATLEKAEGMDETEKAERIAKLNAQIETFSRKAAKELIKGLGEAGSGFKEDVVTALEKLEQSEKEFDEAQKETKQFERRFDMGLEGDTVDPKSDVANYDLIEAGRKSLEEQGKISKELTQENKARQFSAKTLLKHEEGVAEALKAKGTSLEAEVEHYQKTGKLSETANETLQKYIKDNKLKTTNEKLFGAVQATNLAREEGKKLKIAEYDKLQNQEINAQAQVQADLNDLLQKRENLLQAIATGNLTEEERQQNEQAVAALDQNINKTKEKINVDKQSEKQQRDTAKSARDLNKAVKGQGSALGKAAGQVFNYGIAFTALRRIYRETLRTIKDLDKALTEMAVVTTMNREQTWQLTSQMSALARETGFTISEISKLSTIYFRQGRVLSEVIELTRVAAMAARIAGISAAESADFLTSAVNAFQFSADQALAVSDRFAALASQSASSYEELAVGLSKFAAQANVAGVSIDFAMGLLAKGIETTREAPETIGTALKTVIARMRELTDLGKTFEDGMDISRVETALRQVGVALRDEQGQFRNLELVLQEIGGRWETLTTNQRASVAVALAGTRQQSRLIAIMQDFDRTMQLVDISQDSAGATAAQHMQFMQGLEGATIRMQNAYQEFITTISNSEMIIGIVDKITTAVTGLSNGLEKVNFTGRAVMTTLFLLGAVLKLSAILNKSFAATIAFKTAMTTANIKTEALGLIQKWKVVALEKIEAKSKLLTTKATIAKTAAIKAQIILLKIWNMILAANPLILIAVALVAVIAAVGHFSTATERNTQALKENTKALQAANYESRRTVASIQRITDKMEKFNNMPFLTPEQQEELETLNSQLEEIFGQEGREFVAARFADGSINVELQLRLNQLAIEKEINGIHERRQELAESLLRTTDKAYRQAKEWEEFIVPWWGHVLSGGLMSAVQGAVHFTGKSMVKNLTPSIDPDEMDLQNINDFSNLFIEELSHIFDNKLTRETEIVLRDYMENVFDFSQLDARAVSDDLSGFVKETFGDITEVLQDFSKEVSADSPLAERFRDFSNFMKRDLDSDLEQILRNRIQPGLNFLSSISGDDVEGLISTLDYLNLTTDRQIQELGSLFGEDLKEVLELVAIEAQRLSEEQGIAPAQAQEIAWSTIIGSIEDTTKAIKLNNLIFTQSTTDMANSLDHLNSRLRRSRDVQQQWLEGTLGFEELARFFNENDDFFQSMEDVNRFLAGEAISDSVLIERFEEEQKAISRLFNARRQLAELEAQTDIDEDTRQARRSALLAEIAAYQALIQATGELSRTTEAQTRYNAELERYNRLSEVGAETSEDFNRVLEAQSRFFEERTEKIGTDFEKLNERFQRSAQELGFASESLDDYFTVIGGKIVPAFESLEGMSASSAEFIENILEEYQQGMDELFDLFMERRKFELDNEKKLLDDQKKVYEDYFAALDRLERGRERKRSREDLVSQLQRLEGATDERSRRRALELRRELNQTDEEESRTMIQEARQALLKTFDTAYEELEATWARMTADFIGALDSRGAATGEAMANNFASQINSEGLDVELDTKDLDSSLEALEETLSNFVESITAVFLNRDRENFIQRRTGEILAQSGTFGTGNMELAKKIAKGMAEQEAKEKFGFAKGGMVDFTGLAMLHGSKSAPEAVLNPMQTEMFMGLRDALEKVSFNPNGSTGSVQIDNISISTGSMNSNQDFKRAGETLAEAFRGAIQRKGITLNTNKV